MTVPENDNALEYLFNDLQHLRGKYIKRIMNSLEESASKTAQLITYEQRKIILDAINDYHRDIQALFIK